MDYPGNPITGRVGSAHALANPPQRERIQEASFFELLQSEIPKRFQQLAFPCPNSEPQELSKPCSKRQFAPCAELVKNVLLPHFA